MISLALSAHLLGTGLAAILIYIISPFFAEFIEAELPFVYLVLYSLLVVWSFLEGKGINEGNNEKANKLNDLFDREDK